MTNALEKLIDDEFQWRPCTEYPQDMPLWREYARRVLAATAHAYDLTPEDNEQIIFMLNGPWHEKDMLHYCLENCKCGHSRQGALKYVKGIMVRVAGPNLPLALEYRWKCITEIPKGGLEYPDNGFTFAAVVVR